MNISQRIKDFFAEGFGIIRMIPSSLSDKVDAWDWSIAEFEAQDRLHPPPANAI